jgi:hypothetical protein
MAKFKHKPTLVEAEQYHADKPNPPGVCTKYCLDGDWVRPHVHTIHNNRAIILEDKDWIIAEPDGVHYYPCKPDIFAANYERDIKDERLGEIAYNATARRETTNL